MHFSSSFIALFITVTTAAALPARNEVEADYDIDANGQQIAARNWPSKGWHPGWKAGKGYGWGKPDHPGWYPGKKWKRDAAEHEVSEEDVYAALVARSELEAEYGTAPNGQQLSARYWHGNGHGWGWGKPGYHGWYPGKKWKRDSLGQEASDEDLDTALVARTVVEPEHGTGATEQELSARWLWYPGWRWGGGWRHGHHGWKRDTLEEESDAEDTQDLAIRAYVPRYSYAYHPMTETSVEVPDIRHGNKQRDISEDYNTETGELAARDNSLKDLIWEQGFSAPFEIEGYPTKVQEQKQQQGQEIPAQAQYKEEDNEREQPAAAAAPAAPAAGTTTAGQANNNNKGNNHLILANALGTRDDADYDKYNHKNKDKYKDCHDKALQKLHKCLADLDYDDKDKYDNYEKKGEKACYKKFEKAEKDCN